MQNVSAAELRVEHIVHLKQILDHRWRSHLQTLATDISNKVHSAHYVNVLVSLTFLNLQAEKSRALEVQTSQSGSIECTAAPQ
jgi:hypothetical protein